MRIDKVVFLSKFPVLFLTKQRLSNFLLFNINSISIIKFKNKIKIESNVIYKNEKIKKTLD